MPWEKDRPLSEEDRKWYENHIPNEIVRDRAYAIHKTMGWDKIYETIQEREGIYGISKARKGKKRNLVTLLSYDETDAASLVASCDKLEGFDYSGGAPPKSKAINCDLYYNGKKIGNAPEIVGNGVRIDYEKDFMTGATRDTDLISKGIWVEAVNKYVGKEEIDRYGGEMIIHDKMGTKTFNINTETSIDIKERLNKTDQTKPYPCIREKEVKKDGKTVKEDEVVCANWVRFTTKDEAKKEPILL